MKNRCISDYVECNAMRARAYRSADKILNHPYVLSYTELIICN